MKQQFYGMRRANGDWFVFDVKGQTRVPVFRTLAGARRVKAMNPDLMVFRPTPISQRTIEDLASEKGNSPIAFLSSGRGSPGEPLDARAAVSF